MTIVTECVCNINLPVPPCSGASVVCYSMHQEHIPSVYGTFAYPHWGFCEGESRTGSQNGYDSMRPKSMLVQLLYWHK